MNSETQAKIMLVQERLWLFAAALGVICTAYFIITNDNDSAIFFLGFFVLSSLFYILRKRQRRRFLQRMQGPPAPKK